MKGETLIEVLIALTIAVVVITAIAVLSVSSLSNSQFIKNQEQAGKYAQEGMEIMRALRNNDYVDYGNYTGTYCLDKDHELGVSQSSCTTKNIDNVFIRSVTIQQDGGCGVNLAKTTVTVAWTDGKCASNTYCHKSILTSCFSTVQPIQAP